MYSAAVDHFTAWLANNPTDWWSLAHRGAARMSLGDHENAIIDFDKALELRNQKYSWALAQKGEAYRVYLRDFVLWKAGDIDTIRKPLALGISAFDQAIEQSPNYTWALAHKAALHGLAFLMLSKSLDPQAVKDAPEHLALAENGFKQAVELDPLYAWAKAFQGFLDAFKGNFDGARSMVGDALLVNNGNNNLHQNRAMAELYYYGGRYPESLQQGALQRLADPEDRIILYFIAQSLHMQNDPNAQAARVLARHRLRVLRNLVDFMLAGFDYVEGKTDEAKSKIKPLLGQLDVELAFIISSDPIWKTTPKNDSDLQEVYSMVDALRRGQTESPQ